MMRGIDWSGGRLRRREHVVFGLALLLLVALAVWWSRTLSGLIASEHELQLVELQEAAWAQAASIPEVRVGDEHGDYVVVGPEARGRWCVPLAGGAAALCPTPETLEVAEQRFQRRRAMVQGESGLLLVLLLVCVFMLYRLVVAERRFRAEVEFFLGVVTHEMKTPLAALKALLQTLQRGRVPPEQLPELVGLGLEQLRREEQLVGNLLRLQRMRVASASMERAPVPLRPMLEAQQRDRALGGRDRLRVELRDEPVALADAEALRSILDNLLDNAEKFSQGEVRVAARREGREVVLECVDQGCGFDAAQADGIFSAFRRVSGENGTGTTGTGLGLFLSRQLASRMGGDLSAHSPGPGMGATFTLRLPGAEGA
jgi:signal transduction histidine kinase